MTRTAKVLAMQILKRMSDDTYFEDMDQMREDAEELAMAVLSTTKRKAAKRKTRKR